MKSHTQAQIYSASKDTVFAFLADIRNQPKWATGFARELKEIDGEYKAVTLQGEIFFRMETDDVFSAQNATLVEEFENIRKHVEGK